MTPEEEKELKDFFKKVAIGIVGTVFGLLTFSVLHFHLKMKLEKKMEDFYRKKGWIK